MILLAGLFGYREWKKQGLKNMSSIDLGKLPSGYRSFGIDVSHHQGEIDWESFFDCNDSTIRFVYCKATEGETHVDSQWSRNRAYLLRYNIPNGAYHFFQPKKDPSIQAKHFLKHYSIQENDLPPVLDAEITGTSNPQLIEGMKLWLDIIEQKTGRRPIIYTSYHFYNTKFRSLFQGYKFWIANYSDKSERLDDESIIHWQYSDKGTVPGIDADVDLNVSRIAF